MRTTVASSTPGVACRARCTLAWQAAQVIPMTGKMILAGEGGVDIRLSGRLCARDHDLAVQHPHAAAEIEGAGRGRREFDCGLLVRRQELADPESGDDDLLGTRVGLLP